jgi:Transglycosylase SLT domain
MKRLCLNWIRSLLMIHVFFVLQSSLSAKPLAVLQSAPQEFFRATDTDWRNQLQQDVVASRYLSLYVKKGKRQSVALLKRALFYFPIFERHLASRELPLSLKYLPMVESELREEVVSPYHAAGLWQFVPRTARHYQLKVGKHIDQRFDTELSSAAAAQLLADLHVKFDDWFLVLAAYNCGEGRVRRALRYAKTDTYGCVKKYLPSQTRSYISKFIAAACLANYHAEYGIILPLPAQVEPITPAPINPDSLGKAPIHIAEVMALCHDHLVCTPEIPRSKNQVESALAPYSRWFIREKALQLLAQAV